MNKDIFKEINNVVLDLQASHAQTYERPLKKLSQLLKHSDLEPYNADLTKDLNLESFLERSAESAGSMVGSASLDWPDHQKEELGLTLLLIWKLGSEPNYAVQFSFDYFYVSNKIINNIHALTSQLIIPFIRDYKEYILSQGVTQTVLKSPLSKKVFIVHGHDEGPREKVARFLERMGFEAIILHEQANRGRTVIEKVIEYGNVGFAVVLLTPDDEGCVKGGVPEARARQNVLLELGFFIGYLGREKVCALKKGTLEIPSDFAGVVWEIMDDYNGWKQSLSRELEAAGHEIDWNKVMR
ncbi:TIR domain-containing protein [Pantoea agglomerans]|uniref:TIR domain-containing protein n=1 Tax=Enterobacter agglomerans TaxID=549 RepID=UPI003A0A9A94